MAYDSTLIRAVALLETRNGEASIKGPNGEDSNNLFNIKDFTGKGYRALDKAEGSRDAYRVYASQEESQRDFVDLLRRRYPDAYSALTTGDAEKFATGLKAGGYATDPNYIGKVLASVRSVRGEGGPALDTSPEAMAALGSKPKEVSASRAAMALQINSGAIVAGRAAQPADAVFREEAERERAAEEALQVGVPEAFQTAMGDPRVMSYPLMDRITGESDLGPTEPGWKWSEQRFPMTKGMNDDERAYMDEWGVKGSAYAQRAAAQVAMMRDQDKLYGQAGALARFTGSLGAGALDIPSWAIGLGLGKVATMARTGMRALTLTQTAQAARTLPGAVSAAGEAAAVAGRQALGVSAGENIAGQLMVEAMNDVTGRLSTAEDYMGAVAFSMLPVAVTARGTYRGAAEAAISEHARRWSNTVPERAVSEPPELTARRQADEVRRDFDQPVVREDAVMPAELRQAIEDENVGKAPAKRADEVAAVPTLPESKPLLKAEEPQVAEPIPVAEVTELMEFPEILDTALKTSEDRAKAMADDLTAKHQAGDYTDSSQRINALMSDASFEPAGLSKETAARIDRLLAESSQARIDGEPRDLSKPQFWGTADGEPVMVAWSRERADADFVKAEEAQKLPSDGTKGSLREFLSAYAESGNVHDRGQSLVAKHLLDRLKDDPALDAVRVVIKRQPRRGYANEAGNMLTPMASQVVPMARGPKGIAEYVKAMDSWGYGTGLHEAMHTLTISQIDAALKSPQRVSPELRAAVSTLTSVMERLRKDFPSYKTSSYGIPYAAKNEKELVAMFFDNNALQVHLSKMPASKEFGGRLSSAFNEVLHAIKKLLGIGDSASPTARDELAWAIDVMLDKRGGGVVDVNGTPLYGWPGVTKRTLEAERLFREDSGNNPFAGAAPADTPGSVVNPLRVGTAKRNFALGLMEHAKAYIQKNPIDPAKLKVLTEKIGSKSDGLVIAASKNPIMQMVASLVTETTTGAAGRKPTAAIRKALIEQKFIGNSVLDFEAHFEAFRVTNKLPWYDDFTRGEGRTRFNREVYDEILRRRNALYEPQGDASVRAAADAMEGLFSRALAEQKRANTLGSGNLPPSSRGYVPQALDGRKMANATDAEIQELTDHLADHWANTLEWSPEFSKDFARYYINRARGRAMNTKGLELAADASDAVDAIRETLNAMKDTATDPNAVAAILKAKTSLSEKGLGQTRKRLDVALDATMPSGRRVLDFYDDNVIGLARRYANRTSGTVALTDAGIHGSVGVRYLRDAIAETASGDGTPVTKYELDAFDRVMGEMLGTPIEGEVISRVAGNLRLFVGLQRLGSMAFAQVSETMNMIHHLGLSAALNGIGNLPRIMGEVGRIKKGAPAGNHILTSIETWGGEFGGESYKMVMPLDPPDGRVGTYAEDPGLVSRLLGNASHVQQKISFFRGLMAAQHRMVAEQITMRAARLIREADVSPDGRVVFTGSNIEALRDMGFTEELIGAMHTSIGDVAQWDARGKLTAFDLTRLPNPVAAEAFVHAVHRGVSQIIQGTFVGEKTKWMHNDYIKLLAQLRTFGITSTEKQWHRTAMIHGGGAKGYAMVAGLLVAQSTLALPLHLARIQLNSVGRDDQQAFIERQLNPFQLTRALLNYGSLSGMLGDVLDITTGFAGGWSPEVNETVGGFKGAGQASITDAVPALGSADSMAKVLTGGGSLANSLKQLPFSNLPYVIPAINAVR